MSAYKTNINELYSEFYHYNQSVAIAFDIEYIMLITYIISAIKGLFYVCNASAYASFNNGSQF